MKLVIMPRGTGKTMKLVYKSAHENIPIVVPYKRNVNHVKNMAMSVGVKIPEPITAEEMRLGKHVGLPGYDRVLIDDVFSGNIMHKALSHYLNSDVVACTMSTDELSDSI